MLRPKQPVPKDKPKETCADTDPTLSISMATIKIEVLKHMFRMKFLPTLRAESEQDWGRKDCHHLHNWCAKAVVKRARVRKSFGKRKFCNPDAVLRFFL